LEFDYENYCFHKAIYYERRECQHQAKVQEVAVENATAGERRSCIWQQRVCAFIFVWLFFPAAVVASSARFVALSHRAQQLLLLALAC